MHILRRCLFLALILASVLQLCGQQLKEVPSYALKRGDQAPPLQFAFVLQGPPTADVNWQALRGKVVILDFWGTWYEPCVVGIPHLNELVAHYKQAPVQFIAVGHENSKKVSWFLKAHPINTWIAVDMNLSMYKAYTAFGIPYSVIVDKQGIVAAALNPKDLNEHVIDAVLAGKTPVHPPLPADAYWDPETAAQYFSKVGQEGPPEK